jgi:hypothetical protein
MYRRDFLNALGFNHNQVVDDQADSVTQINADTFINDREFLLGP